MAGDWSNEQNDAIIADYFVMLADDIAGRPYSKAEHNGLLLAVIGRPRGSIEHKHQNISAVLKGLDEDWNHGYKPAFNFQASLVDPLRSRAQGLSLAAVRDAVRASNRDVGGRTLELSEFEFMVRGRGYQSRPPISRTSS